jgi:hypothetical protein
VPADGLVDDRRLALSLDAAAAGLGEDLAGGVILKEEHLQDRLRAALAEKTVGAVERERHVEVPGFQGVGPVDIVISELPGGEPRGLVECKWSVDLKRDKIYEGAWDAIKIALAAARHHAVGWLVTGAPEDSWGQDGDAGSLRRRSGGLRVALGQGALHARTERRDDGGRGLRGRRLRKHVHPRPRETPREGRG